MLLENFDVEVFIAWLVADASGTLAVCWASNTGVDTEKEAAGTILAEIVVNAVAEVSAFAVIAIV